MIGATVGVDDHVGHDVLAGWLHEDMDAAPRPRTAHRVADDPAHRVARGDWPRAAELLAFPQPDVGDLSRRRIDLEECAFGPCILLVGGAVALALGLDKGLG